MKKHLRDLLLRALGAIENAADLSDDDRQDLIEDLQVASDKILADINAEA